MKANLNLQERLAIQVLVNGMPNASIREWRILNIGFEAIEIKDDEANVKLESDAGKAKKVFNLDEQFVTLLRKKLEELNEKKMVPRLLLPLANFLKMDMIDGDESNNVSTGTKGKDDKPIPGADQ